MGSAFICLFYILSIQLNGKFHCSRSSFHHPSNNNLFPYEKSAKNPPLNKFFENNGNFCFGFDFKMLHYSRSYRRNQETTYSNKKRCLLKINRLSVLEPFIFFRLIKSQIFFIARERCDLWNY